MKPSPAHSFGKLIFVLALLMVCPGGRAAGEPAATQPATSRPASSPAGPPSSDEERQPIEWVTREVKAPRVSFHTFDSIAAASSDATATAASRPASTPVSYHLFRPAAYDRQPERRFPVVYWLHGSGGGLGGIARLSRLFDAAIESGKAPPFLVVFVNGLEGGMYCDWKSGRVRMETVIVEELVPHIDATYRTVASRDGRLLDGFSMGGYGAARLGFNHPSLFGAVSMLGAGPLQPELRQTPRVGVRGREALLRRVYGNSQDYFHSVSPWKHAEDNALAIAKSVRVRQVVGEEDETHEFNRRFHEHMERLKIPHEWRPLPNVDHNPLKTFAALGDEYWSFYREAFANTAGDEPSRP